VGVAVNVTGLPWQQGFADAAMEIVTGSIGFTTMVIPLEVAGLFDMHSVSEEVKIQVTTSLFTGV
jgi:hypothetical protein